MLLVSENGTGYADEYFHVSEGLIIDNFTLKPLGRFIEGKETASYICCDPRYKRPLTRWQKIKRWFHDEQMRVDHQIQEEAKGSLVETMKGLER